MADRGMVGNTTQPMTRVDSYHVPQRGMGSYQRRKGAKPVYAPYTLEESHRDHRDPALQAKLYEEMVGFPNLANNKFVVEQAKHAVLSGLKDVFNVMEFLRNKWLILYRLYRGETLNEFQYGRTQLHSPTPFKIVETLHPRMMRTVFGSERWFKLYGELDHHDASAQAQEALCRDQLRAMDFVSKASRFLRDGLIYGTAIQKTYWKQEVGEMSYREGVRKPHPRIPGASEIELKEVTREELVFDGNYTENVSIFDFLTSPSASDIDSAEWCADRSHWPDFKVKAMGEMGHWMNLSELKDHPGSRDLSFGDEFKERKSYAYGVFDPREASHAPHIPHYQIIDWWGPLVISNSSGNYETKLCNVVMVEPDSKQTIARITECPFWHKKKPYEAWRYTDLEDEFYGIGALEMIARSSLEKDVKRNLLMAAAQLEANPMWIISDQANIPDGQLILQPGLTLRVPDVSNSIAPLTMPQVSDAALKAENVLEKEMQDVSGVTAQVQGVAGPVAGGGKTATQHTSELNEANMRLSDPIRNYDLHVTTPMLEKMTWNNMQFQSYSKTIRDIGPLGVRFQDRFTVSPEDLIGRFIVQPLSGFKLLTKQTQVQQLVNLLDRGPPINQMYGPQAVKMPKLMAYILEHGFDIRNAEDFITIPPEEAGLLTAMEEHEMWYHGNVPPRRPDDNDLRHILAHMEEFKEQRFAFLEQADPGVAAKARAHVAEHMRKVSLLQEQQEKMMMEMAQMATAMGIGGPGGQGGSPVPGAAGPGQDPGSPQIRRNENERGEGQQQKSEAMKEAPNAGAQ